MSTKTVHEQLTDFAKEISDTSKQIARLELLIDLQKHFAAKAERSKSIRDKKLYLEVIEHLEGLN